MFSKSYEVDTEALKKLVQDAEPAFDSLEIGLRSIDTNSHDINVMVDAALLALFARAREVRLAKSADYGPSWVDTGVQGIAVRAYDKVSRALQLASGKEAKVRDEKLFDTFMDLANYALFGALLCVE